VFISYTDRDGLGKTYANELRHVLEQNGFADVYYFDHSRAGSLGLPVWGESGIPMEIRNRDVLIVMCTTAILASPPAEREYCIAIQADKLVIPLRYDDAPVPSALPHFYDSFDNSNYAQIFRIVADNLPNNYRRHCENLDRIRLTLASIQISDEHAQPSPEVGEVGPS